MNTAPIVPAYQVVGSGARPLVFAAGTAFPAATWTPEVLEPFRRDYAAVVFDYRGTGGTPETDAVYSTRLFAHDLIAILDDLGMDSVDIIGHSFGGRVAQWVAIDAPERVRNLVLAASGAGRAPGLPSSGPQQVDVVRAAITSEGYRGFMSRALSEFLFGSSVLTGSRAIVDQLFEAFWSSRPSEENYLRHVVARQEHSTHAHLGQISSRTLVMVGENDTLPLASGSHLDQSVALAKAIRGCDFVAIPYMRHGLFWENPVGCAAVIAEWLDSGLLT